MKKKCLAALALLLIGCTLLVSCDGLTFEKPMPQSKLPAITDHPEVSVTADSSETGSDALTSLWEDTESMTAGLESWGWGEEVTLGDYTGTLATESANEPTTAPETETESITSPQPNTPSLDQDETLDVPGANYGGTEIRILQKDSTVDEMYAERRVGELINDAVYERNKFVENYLGVKLVFDSAPANVANYVEFKAKVDAAVASGYDMYHIISNYTYNAPTLIQEGAFLDINGIDPAHNAIDLDKRWWNQSFHNESMINGKFYLLTGDITTTVIAWAEVVFYNNTLVKKYMGEDYDILQAVYDWEWTYGNFLTMIHKVGNGEETGEWGYTAPTNSYSLDGMIMGQAMDLTYRDRYNSPNISINTMRNIVIGERMRELYNNDVSAKCAEGQGADIFCDGKSMFYTFALEYGGRHLRSTTLDYGILPPPLYDGYQEEYRIIPQDNYSSLSILCHVVTSLPAVTKTLEVMGSESYINLRHCIQEKCYRQRYLKTDPKGQMFDYIVDNLYFDFGYTYGKIISHPVMLIRNYARYPAGHNSYIESLTSALEVAEISAINQLEYFLRTFYD